MTGKGSSESLTEKYPFMINLNKTIFARNQIFFRQEQLTQYANPVSEHDCNCLC